MSLEAIPLYVFLLSPFIFFLYNILRQQNHREVIQKKLPGPPSLPIIGNFHMLGSLPHRTLHSLSQKYGPIMSFRLGQVPAIVVSTSKTAELFLKTYDTVFANRPKTQVTNIMFYGKKSFGFAEYGPYWRTMKKTFTLNLLSASKVELFAPIRKDEMDMAVKSLQRIASSSTDDQVVNLSDTVHSIIENIIYRILLGSGNNHDQFDLKKVVRDLVRLEGTFNLADFIPWLGAFDLQGIARECKKLHRVMDELLEKTIKEHQQAAHYADKYHSKDIVDIMLSMMDQPMDPQSEEKHILDRTNIKAVLLEISVASIDTTAILIDWALSELLRHPRVMNILQDEIKNEVGLSRMVHEKDLERLKYLDMVINETLRLYPVGPLLLPRESRDNITIEGYYIQKKTRVIVNAWAIGRDPNVWLNAEEFYPERFMNKKVDFPGNDLSFIPFGFGRRSCPGMNLGLTNAKFVLAQLVHCFDWKFPCSVTRENLNMEERFGLSMPRVHPLKAIPTYRLASNSI